SSPSSLLSHEFAEVLRTFPDLQIVVEHLAGAKPGMDVETFKPVLKLAEHKNLTIKLPGFGEFCHLPHPFEIIPPFADLVLEAFGPHRTMWGSDWPPERRRETDDNALDFPLA